MHVGGPAKAGGGGEVLMANAGRPLRSRNGRVWVVSVWSTFSAGSPLLFREGHRPRATPSDDVVVRRDDDGLARVVEPAQQVDDNVAVVVVQRAGWFVGENDVAGLQ